MRGSSFGQWYGTGINLRMKHLTVCSSMWFFQQPSRPVKAHGQMLRLIVFLDYAVSKMVQQNPTDIVLGNIV